MKSYETFKQNTGKILKKKFTFTKAVGSKNELIHMFF